MHSAKRLILCLHGYTFHRNKNASSYIVSLPVGAVVFSTKVGQCTSGVVNDGILLHCVFFVLNIII